MTRTAIPGTAHDGIGRPSTADGRKVSRDLRISADPWIRRRRNVAALAMGSIASMGAVTAYQMGLLKHLPEPPLGAFDADKVDASGEAYFYLQAPDGSLGMLSYAATVLLAGMGDKSRATQRPWLPLLLAAKVAVDAASSLYLTAEQASRHRRYCSWCLAATGLTLAMVPQVVPEARAAARTLLERRA